MSPAPCQRVRFTVCCPHGREATRASLGLRLLETLPPARVRLYLSQQRASGDTMISPPCGSVQESLLSGLIGVSQSATDCDEAGEESPLLADAEQNRSWALVTPCPIPARGSAAAPGARGFEQAASHVLRGDSHAADNLPPAVGSFAYRHAACTSLRADRGAIVAAVTLSYRGAAEG